MNLNNSPVGFGSPRDHDRTNVPLTQHESVLLSRLVTVEFTDGLQSSLDAKGNNDVIVGGDDERSDNTNDESIFSRSSLCVAGVEEEENGLDIVNMDESEELRLTLNRLHIKNQKPLNKYATTDVFEHGLVLMRNLHKTRTVALNKIQRKRDFVREAVRYFSYQMEKRRELLARCSLKLANPTTEYYQPPWKVRYKTYMSTVNN